MEFHDFSGSNYYTLKLQMPSSVQIFLFGVFFMTGLVLNPRFKSMGVGSDT